MEDVRLIASWRMSWMGVFVVWTWLRECIIKFFFDGVLEELLEELPAVRFLPLLFDMVRLICGGRGGRIPTGSVANMEFSLWRVDVGRVVGWP